MGLSGILHISLSHLTPCPQSPQNEINHIFLLKKKKTLCVRNLLVTYLHLENIIGKNGLESYYFFIYLGF